MAYVCMGMCSCGHRCGSQRTTPSVGSNLPSTLTLSAVVSTLYQLASELLRILQCLCLISVPASYLHACLLPPCLPPTSVPASYLHACLLPLCLPPTVLQEHRGLYTHMSRCLALHGFCRFGWRSTCFAACVLLVESSPRDSFLTL